MRALKNIAEDEADILSRLRACVARIQKLITPSIPDISSGVTLLRLLRSEAAEDINQLQHAALALEAARNIQAEHPETASLKWFWHPFQTSGINEPDLQARKGTKVVISAEVTASESPDGTIAVRMAQTLKKLQTLPGKRFYFVRTEPMRKRAQTKVRKGGFDITVATIRNAWP